MRLHAVGGGQPADDPGSRLPGRLATIASRATTGIHGAVSAVTGILTMVIIWARCSRSTTRHPQRGEPHAVARVGRTPLAGAPEAARTPTAPV